MLQLHIIVLYHKLIHNATTHLNYLSGKRIPGPGCRTKYTRPSLMFSISKEFGSLTPSCLGAPGEPAGRGPRPNIIYLKTEFGSFKKSRPSSRPSYNPGTESMPLSRKSWAQAPENSLTPGPPWALGMLTRINTGAP